MRTTYRYIGVPIGKKDVKGGVITGKKKMMRTSFRNYGVPIGK